MSSQARNGAQVRAGLRRPGSGSQDSSSGSDPDWVRYAPRLTGSYSVPGTHREESREALVDDTSDFSLTVVLPSSHSSSENADARTQLDDAYGLYGIQLGEPYNAKTLASKVANDGLQAPGLEMIEALDLTRNDLAEALQFASEFILDECEQLCARENGNDAGRIYRRIWEPISSEGVAINREAPPSMLRYVFFICLLAVEEVHSWTDRGRPSA